MAWIVALWNLLVAHWSLIVFAIALPFVAQLISRSTWSGAVRGYVALALCLVVGILTPLQQGVPADPAHVLPLMASLFGGTTAAYLVFKSWRVTCPWLDALLKFGESASAI